jgi:ribosome-binding ATPase YchF (GTP1/OBG family)
VLDKGKPAREVAITAEEWPIFRTLNLISAKPMIYLCNVKESDVAGNKFTETVAKRAKDMSTASLIISARLEEEVANLDQQARGDMTQEQLLEQLGGIKESGLSQVIRESRERLGFHCYYTCGEKEAASWRKNL